MWSKLEIIEWASSTLLIKGLILTNANHYNMLLIGLSVDYVTISI